MKLKKLLIGTMLSLMILGTSIPVMADYSKGYSFDIAWEKTGARDHSLTERFTTTSVTADTYWASGKIKPDKSTYKVALTRPLKSYKTSEITANGSSSTRSFGRVTKNNYAVNVTKVSGGDYGDRVKGSGTIDQ